MKTENSWQTSVEELISLFREALCSLIPIVERARMSWKQPDAYDDWDQICEAVYRSIVVGSIENANHININRAYPTVDYDRRIRSYDKNSFISADNMRKSCAFVCFETEKEPFDFSLFADLDLNFNVIGHRKIPTEDAAFLFVSRNISNEKPDYLREIVVSL